MAARFNAAAFLVTLSGHAYQNYAESAFSPCSSFDDVVELAQHIGQRVLLLADYVLAESGYHPAQDEDNALFSYIFGVFGNMLLGCIKRLPSGDRVVDERVVVTLVLSHVVLRYMQSAMRRVGSYKFPGSMRCTLWEKGLAGMVGGALVPVIHEIVPQVPSVFDALWASGCLRSIVDGSSVCFVELPIGSRLSRSLVRHGYVESILEACQINKGLVDAGMGLLRGYNWDQHAVVDGVRCCCVVLV